MNKIVEGIFVQVVWTFENKEKLDPFIKVLEENEIPCVLLSKDNKEAADGLILTVEDAYYKKARKLLMSFRKRISNRHHK